MPVDSVKIAILAENTTYKTHFYAEHGLSFYIEKGDTKILFDTRGSPGLLSYDNYKYSIPYSRTDKREEFLLDHRWYSSHRCRSQENQNDSTLLISQIYNTARTIKSMINRATNQVTLFLSQ